MVSLFVQDNVQNTQPKRRTESRDIDKTIWFIDSAKSSEYSAAEWRRIEFVCDIIMGMAGSKKRWRKRRFEPSQETGLKKMVNGNV